MSIRAVNWAIDVCARIGTPPGERLVLLVIAKHHNDKTGACFPSYDTIAEQTGFKRRKVIYSVADLEANGLIFTQDRRVGGHQGSNNFVLFGRPSSAVWAATRVHHKAPCESAPQCTQTRVHPSAPDRDWYNKGAAAAAKLRLVAGGAA